MKKYILVIFAISLASVVTAQGWKNSNFLRGTEDISVITSTTDTDNNTIVFGYFTGTLQPRNQADIVSRGFRDYFLAKYDTLSNELWVRSLGSSGLEFIQGGCVTGPDNSIYLTGGFQSDFYYTDVDFLTSTGSHDIFLAKFDANGTNTWCLNVGSGNGYQRASALNIDNAGNILLAGFYQDSVNIAGETTLYTNAFKDYFYGKFNSSNGDLIWAKAIESINSNFSGFVYSFAPASDHYILTGVFADSVELGNDTIVSSTVNYYDTHVIKTDTDGEILWYRKIQGNLHDYSYNAILGPDNSIYVTGYYNSTSLTFDSTATETVVINENKGTYDFFVAKYDTNGTLQWVRVNGSTGQDRLLRSAFFNGDLWVTGYFTNELNWGSQTLKTDGGAADTDMFYGSLDPDGNYTGATSYYGTGNSTEWGRSVFSDSKNLYATMRTNSIFFQAGDSAYSNPSGVFYIIVGSVGCVPISVSVQTKIDVTTCYGDSTGLVSLLASGGLDENYKYSIGEDYPYQTSPLFSNVPGGTYTPQVLDGKNCFGSGTDFILNQPTEIVISSVDSSDVACFGESTGSINVNATGGTGSLVFSLDSASTFPYAVGTPANVGVGIYDSIAVSDANNCILYFDGKATIAEPTQITLVLDSASNAACNGTSTGRIEMSAAGGTLPYEFSVDGSTYQADSVFAVAAGSYKIKVRDANGCELSADALDIVDSTALSIAIVSSENKKGSTLGSIVVEASGESESYTFTISPSEGSQSPDGTFTDLPAGTYSIEVEDLTCGSTASTGDIIILGKNNLYVLQASLYPNPSNGMITVEFNTDKAEMTMEIFSIDGKRVMSQEVYSAAGKVNETLDLSDLDKGIYMMRIDKQTLSSSIVIK